MPIPYNSIFYMSVSLPHIEGQLYSGFLGSWFDQNLLIFTKALQTISQLACDKGNQATTALVENILHSSLEALKWPAEGKIGETDLAEESGYEGGIPEVTEWLVICISFMQANILKIDQYFSLR